MKNLYTLEIKKSLLNKFFIAAVVIGSLICVYSACICILGHYNGLALAEELSNGNTYIENPALSASSLFNRWIGQEWNSFASSLFFLLLPLISSIPYSWSYLSEKKCGYMNNVFTRTKKGLYLKAKFTASFISGFLCAVIPMVLNVIIVSAFIPAIKPNVFWDMYYNMPIISVFSEMFYKAPFLFVIFKIMLTGIFGGSFAVLGMSLGTVVKNKFVVVSLPFVFILLFNYLSNVIFSPLFEVSPVQFLYGGGDPITNWLVILIEITVLISLSAMLIRLRGEKRDAL